MSQENVELAQAVSMGFANEGDIVALLRDEERSGQTIPRLRIRSSHEDFETVVRGWPDGERTYAGLLAQQSFWMDWFCHGSSIDRKCGSGSTSAIACCCSSTTTDAVKRTALTRSGARRLVSGRSAKASSPAWSSSSLQPLLLKAGWLQGWRSSMACSETRRLDVAVRALVLVGCESGLPLLAGCASPP